MDRLQPGRYDPQPRSLSAGSSHSSASSSSSQYSARGSNHHTPSTSPSHSESGWNEYGADTHAQGLSPLEMLVKRGNQVQQDIVRPEAGPGSGAPISSGKSRIYERATALSRKTSVRQKPIQPSPDPDDFIDDTDDAQSIRSINLHGPSSGFTRTPRTGSRGSDSTYDASSPQRFADSSPSHGWNQQQQRQSSDLLGNAFRSSIASDISFNSITGENERMSIMPDLYAPRLGRRGSIGSIDTVRSSEFGEDGRWGRAWANRAEDEESAYEESAFGGDDDEDDDDRRNWGEERFSIMSKDVDIDPSQGPSSFVVVGGSKLDSIANQWKTTHRAANAPRQQQRDSRREASGHSQLSAAKDKGPLPPIQTVDTKEHVVNLTRTSAAAAPSAKLVVTSPTEQRHSHVPTILGSHYRDSTLSLEQTPTVGAFRPSLGHRSNDSTSTLGSGGAHVYVYPPSPSSSEGGKSSRSGQARMPGSNRRSGGELPQGSSAIVETMTESPKASMESYGRAQVQHHLESKPRGPVAPSTLLAHPHGSPVIGPNARRLARAGHPAGRPPPPTPGESGAPSSGYFDPNRPSPSHAAARPALGQARAQAIAAANGRESIVSDLDVETLRLDGSSRRDSTSTISSMVSSRMSVGTVHYEDIGLPPDAEQLSDHVTYGSNHAGWEHITRHRSPDLSNPRRALTSPTEATLTPKEVGPPSRSNTHPTQTALWPPSGTPGLAPRAPWQEQQQEQQQGTGPGPGSLQQRPSYSSMDHGSATPKAAPTLRSTKSSSTVGTQAAAAAAAAAGATTSSAAEELLSQGITYHEQGDLSRSAFYFERSAKVEGGCVVGMCMFGMALREGWGARKDPRKGFEWIQKAAAKAGELMQGAKTEAELKAIKSELKLSVYELGKCFCYGWGVKMDKHMALEYFELAAKLGDADAQAEAGALYASGKGCKKDLKKAAMYYRMAEAGGYDTVGLSWIHKDKYK